MATFNKVMLMGNVTRDLELRYTPKGMAVLDVGLAVSRRYKADGGEMREDTTFVDITFWGQQAETLVKYSRKGQPLFVEGRLQLDTWDDKNSGKKMSRLRVVGENFQLLYGREGAQGGGGGGYQGGGGGYQSGGGGGYQGGGGGYQGNQGNQGARQSAPPRPQQPAQSFDEPPGGYSDPDEQIPF